MRHTVRVAPLKNLARICECGRVASYRITLWQLSGEGRDHAVNLILCGVCFRDWMQIEGDELAQAGRLDTTSIDGGGGACYGTYKGDVEDTVSKEKPFEYEQPLPKRVDDLLAELRILLLRSPHLDKGGQVIVHVAPGRGELKLQLPPEVKKF